MTCPACGGSAKGCDECDYGCIYFEQCPLEIITRDVWEVMQYAELYEKGLPPVHGGALDQAYVFTWACRVIWAEENKFKPKGLFE